MAILPVRLPDPEKLAQITADDGKFKSQPGYYHWSCTDCGASWTGKQEDQIIIRINKHLEDGIICPACKSKCGGGTLGDSEHAQASHEELVREGVEMMWNQELERRTALGYKCYDCKGTGCSTTGVTNFEELVKTGKLFDVTAPRSCRICQGYGWRG